MALYARSDDSLNVLPYKNKHFKADEIHKIIGKNGVEYLIAQIGLYAYPDSQYLTVVASPQDQAVVVYEGIDFFDSYQREHKGDEK